MSSASSGKYLRGLMWSMLIGNRLLFSLPHLQHTSPYLSAASRRSFLHASEYRNGSAVFLSSSATSLSVMDEARTAQDNFIALRFNLLERFISHPWWVLGSAGQNYA